MSSKIFSIFKACETKIQEKKSGKSAPPFIPKKIRDSGWRHIIHRMDKADKGRKAL